MQHVSVAQCAKMAPSWPIMQMSSPFLRKRKEKEREREREREAGLDANWLMGGDEGRAGGRVRTNGLI